MINALKLLSPLILIAFVLSSRANEIAAQATNNSPSEINGRLAQPVLLVSGTLKNSGAFDFSSFMELPSNTVSPSDPNGNFVIESLNSSDQVLYSIRQKSNSKIHVDYFAGTVGPHEFDMGGTPVVVKFPMDKSVQWFRVVKDGKVIAKTSVNSGLVKALIERIPWGAYKVCAEEVKDTRSVCKTDREKEKASLENEEKQISQLLNLSDLKRASAQMQTLIEKVKLYVDPHYVPADISELSQAQVMTGLEKIIANVANSKK